MVEREICINYKKANELNMPVKEQILPNICNLQKTHLNILDAKVEGERMFKTCHKDTK